MLPHIEPEEHLMAMAWRELAWWRVFSRFQVKEEEGRDVVKVNDWIIRGCTEGGEQRRNDHHDQLEEIDIYETQE